MRRYLLTEYRIHVYADLKPYICTFPLCKDELVIFPTRKLWVDHETNEHRRKFYWTCSECSDELPSSSALTEHLRLIHNLIFSECHLDSVLDAAKITKMETLQNEKCPLCLEDFSSSSHKLLTHICRHMESIALASLPRDTDSDTEQHSENQSDISSSSKPSSKKSLEDEENEGINCLCHSQEDTKAFVLCGVCNTWQHIGCYYISPADVPDVHECYSYQRKALKISEDLERLENELVGSVVFHMV